MTTTLPRARVVADSISPEGVRLTTIEARIHRFVLAELNTHRSFSRNSASSRAIPVARTIESVETDPALPVEFGTARRGMQAGPPLASDLEARAVWLEARDEAVSAARRLVDLGVHKQLVNRLLEPFMWHTVIVTATDWDGFWMLRCSDLAQPEIRVAAEAMREARRRSTPVLVDEEGWHLPYLQADEGDLDLLTARKVAVARCARVSYLTHDGRRDLAEDLAFYDRLISADPPHASPLEHVATPAIGGDRSSKGNLRGWVQLRHMALIG
jgi:hypothetical protein